MHIIKLRIPNDDYETLKRAAVAQLTTVPALILDACVRRAQQVLDERVSAREDEPPCR